MQTIQLELSPAIEAKLDRIIELLSQGAQPVPPQPKPAKAPAPLAEEVVMSGEPLPEDKPEAEPATEPAKTYTQEDIRRLVVQLSAKGPAVKEKVREVINAYAARVSDLEESTYNEVGAKLAALEV